MLEAHCKECERIEENCMFTAETHHILAKRQKRWFVILQLVPAVTSALLGTLVVGQVVPRWVGIIAVVSAIVTAIGTVMNPQQGYFEHLNAAKAFTTMKHDARALREVFGVGTTDKEFAGIVKSLHDRYNDLVRLSPPTEDWAFEKARQRIRRGVHKPDAEG